jgi:hypothetical protein
VRDRGLSGPESFVSCTSTVGIRSSGRKNDIVFLRDICLMQDIFSYPVFPFLCIHHCSM